ncbi:MAG: AraC family ligand binding domain-containing protein [Hyphomicrobiales bacterium]
MELITQEQSLGTMPLAGGETVRLWRDARYDALECISATFHTHEYARHTHETYVVGIIEAGCETYFCEGETYWAGPGDFCMVNPEQVHDGAPHDGGYRYRMIYPTVGFMTEIAEDVFDRPCSDPPVFRSPRVHDPELAVEFHKAHVALEASGDVLERDERMILVLGKLLARHAGAPSFRSSRGERSAIGLARAFIDENYGDEIGLDVLAAVSRLSRHHFIRAFKRETGMTPHAYVTDRRVREARKLLAGGMAPANAAAVCGFYDQSHLNRLFKARVGVTPGAFRRA